MPLCIRCLYDSSRPPKRETTPREWLREAPDDGVGICSECPQSVKEWDRRRKPLTGERRFLC